MANSYRASGRNAVGEDRPQSGLTVSTSVDVPGASGNTYTSNRLSRPSSIAVGLSKWWDMPLSSSGSAGRHSLDRQVQHSVCHGSTQTARAGDGQAGAWAAVARTHAALAIAAVGTSGVDSQPRRCGAHDTVRPAGHAGDAGPDLQRLPVYAGQAAAIPSPPTAPGTVMLPIWVRDPLGLTANSSTIPFVPVCTYRNRPSGVTAASVVPESVGV
jgi:hypothetical protein